LTCTSCSQSPTHDLEHVLVRMTRIKRMSQHLIAGKRNVSCRAWILSRKSSTGRQTHHAISSSDRRCPVVEELVSNDDKPTFLPVLHSTTSFPKPATQAPTLCGISTSAISGHQWLQQSK
jgi:hypothetical protein